MAVGSAAKGAGLGAQDNEIDFANHPMLERCPWLVRVRMIETALVQDLVDQQQTQVQ